MAVMLVVGLAVPSNAGAEWVSFGEFLLAGGMAENPLMMGTGESESLRGWQNQATTRLTLGARAEWDLTECEVVYSPYGEFYEESEINQVSHALGVFWGHRYTPRLSFSLREDFSYSPRLPTEPGATYVGGALVSDSSLVSNDFRPTLFFRATPKSSLSWTYRNLVRNYGSDELMDTTVNALGMEYSRTFGQHVIGSTGYEFGVYAFGDNVLPPVPFEVKEFCRKKPQDPKCVALSVLEAQPFAEDQGFGRHRGFIGYAFDIPAGFHLDIDAGYDFLVASRDEFGSIAEPFVRSTVGWSGHRLHASLGYEQGLDEGGAIIAAAEIRIARFDGRFRFTDSASLEISVLRDARLTLDDEIPGDTTLTTLRGTTSFIYELGHGWSVLASVAHDRQTSTGTFAVPSEINASRFALGAAWSFGRDFTRARRPPPGNTGPVSGGMPRT